ncbi:MAG: LLM class flavin-dependent oxidoreductase [Acidimicrobiia bacterium]|jgi:luciferase family oxidoreductase group 1|nr:LLM class flavin-dependent oxidoreductase [Acidimicrobiia bacterium]
MARDQVPLSILDLALVSGDDTVAEALQTSLLMAQAAEERGYRRVWYAEHHNIPSIASAATAVLIAHVAAHTDEILLGSGGIMLPNHSPLTIAEQFGTLASLHPGRIELGLGRAPGGDPATARALRRPPTAAASFPQDVAELQAYLAGDSIVPQVNAIPGAGTRVPLTILGSSLYGAQLAAQLGLPYAFASHFAPDELSRAIPLYRDRFEPSDQLAAPTVMAGINVVIAETEQEAARLFGQVIRLRVASFLARGRRLSEAELDQVVASPGGQQVAAMLRHTAVGTPATIRAQLDDFANLADADELIVVHNAIDAQQRIQAVHLLADAY